MGVVAIEARFGRFGKLRESLKTIRAQAWPEPLWSSNSSIQIGFRRAKIPRSSKMLPALATWRQNKRATGSVRTLHRQLARQRNFKPCGAWSFVTREAGIKGKG